VKAVHLETEPFSVENGLLTPTRMQKLKNKYSMHHLQFNFFLFSESEEAPVEAEIQGGHCQTLQGDGRRRCQPQVKCRVKRRRAWRVVADLFVILSCQILFCILPFAISLFLLSTCLIPSFLRVLRHSSLKMKKICLQFASIFLLNPGLGKPNPLPCPSLLKFIWRQQLSSVSTSAPPLPLNGGLPAFVHLSPAGISQSLNLSPSPLTPKFSHNVGTSSLSRLTYRQPSIIG
jgi:hypothetical protein